MKLLNHNGELAEMEYFDCLPAAMREALRNSDHNWPAEQWYREIEELDARRRAVIATKAAAAAFIRDNDTAQHRRDAERGIVCPGQR